MFVLVAVLTLVVTQRQTSVRSLDADIQSDTPSIGAGYGGTVIKQHVEDAQQVEIKGYGTCDVNAQKGTIITFEATLAGRVDGLTALLGTTPAPSAPFAKITVTGSQDVEAHGLLTPRDHERVAARAQVSILLPDNQTIGAQ